jgi:2-polyprenyl-3-methyl-5-hydroxy-6-metoxy-1,4-benzoquinol methylase
VFAMDVLEHISDEERAIAEISSVLRREGKLIVSAPVEIGIPLFVREAYRFFDGDRRQTKTILELLKGIAKSPYCEKVGHRGYDYRRTIEFVDNHFEITSMEFCPLPIFRELNPTVIFIATN